MTMKSIALVALLCATPTFANEDIADQYPSSVLYAKPVEFIPGVFSAIGATAPSTYDLTFSNGSFPTGSVSR